MHQSQMHWSCMYTLMQEQTLALCAAHVSCVGWPYLHTVVVCAPTVVELHRIACSGSLTCMKT